MTQYQRNKHMDRLSGSLPFFSIVTVTFNAEAYLEKTLTSIIRQDFADTELIVVDGQSTDRTLEIVDRYREHVSVLVVEKDQGIYDAMNKGIQRASGTYVNFMNAGDTFYDEQTLTKVHRAIVAQGAALAIDIAYGKVVNISSEQSNYQYEGGKPLSKKAFFLSMPMCHQTMFTRTVLFDEIGRFPLERKAGALYDWLGAYYAQRQTLAHILFIPERIAYYLVGGYSFRMMKSISRERLTTAKKYFSRKYQMYNHMLYVVTWLKAELLGLMTRYHLLDRYRRVKYELLHRSV